MSKKEVFKIPFANKELIVELGTMAHLSAQSVVIRYGNSVVLTTVNYNDKAINQDFFPLTVMFQEKLYSIGKIPGGFLRREGFPGEFATLCARLIDRSIRPLFPDGFNNEVQVVNNVFALDEDSDIRFAAAFGTSLALALSGLPFQGPTSLVIIGKENENLIINPTKEQLLNGTLELIVGGTKDAINMVEAGCFDISEQEMIKAIKIAHQEIVKLVNFQNDIIKYVKPKTIDFSLVLVPEPITTFLQPLQMKIEKIITIADKTERKLKLNALVKETQINFFATELFSQLEVSDELANNFIIKGINNLLKTNMRKTILNKRTRIDGRKLNEIRPLSSIINVLPVVHGSAIFSRGETQVLSVLTLGALAEQQIIDDLGKDDSKRFMHHYNFPPFSVGETGRMGKPSRREIGHGALGEKAISQILPSESAFPYTIRIVSEVLASNGSTSQASICASSLALMAGGVPIREQIAGIAMGLIKENDQYAILTDIQGLEDHLGDMDFKVAGTKHGICALQMDIKIAGLDFTVLEEALTAAQTARLQVLANMNQTISQPAASLAVNAPKIFQTIIPVDKIRDVIGSGGKIINKIISECDNIKIDIENDGRLILYHSDQAILDKAWTMINNIINPKPITIGDEFVAKVVKITNFGAFVNLKDNVDGLVHISEFAKQKQQKVADLNEIIKNNDVLNVKVKSIDEKTNKLSLQLMQSIK